MIPSVIWRRLVSDLSQDRIPEPVRWRSCILYWPISVRRAWAQVAEKHQAEGKDWKEAEWEAFKFIYADTLRHERAHPDKPIPWRLPWSSPNPTPQQFDESPVADDWFFKELALGAALNRITLNKGKKKQKEESATRKKKQKHGKDNQTFFSV